jgi:hypothetical protein
MIARPNGHVPAGQDFHGANRSPSAQADGSLGRQNGLAAALALGPYLSAQRQVIRAAFGPAAERSTPQGRCRPAQRKVRVAATDTVLDSVVAATSAASRDCTPLATALTSPALHTVKTTAALQGLADGNQEEVLGPSKHVIGEVHTASQFDRIRGEWPGVQSMGEGVYTVEETALELPAARSSAHTTFEDNLQGQHSPYLPLDNFHAAAMARAIGFLVIWNEHQAAASGATRRHLSSRITDITNLYNAYVNVSAGVVTRGGENMKWYHLFSQYKGDIEKKYKAIFDVLTSGSGTAADACFAKVKMEVDAGRAVPALSADEFSSVRSFIKVLIPAIGDLLSVSVAAQASAATTRTETKAAATYVGRSANTLRSGDMQSALDRVNPTRERYMAQQIGKLAVPGLVKVGDAHIAGLRTLGPADSTFYDNAGQFDAALLKRAADL